MWLFLFSSQVSWDVGVANMVRTWPCLNITWKMTYLVAWDSSFVSDTSHLQRKCKKMHQMWSSISQMLGYRCWPCPCTVIASRQSLVSLLNWLAVWYSPAFWKRLLCIFSFSFLGTVEVINARETAPQGIPSDLLSGCARLPIGKDLRVCSAQKEGWRNWGPSSLSKLLSFRSA